MRSSGPDEHVTKGASAMGPIAAAAAVAVAGFGGLLTLWVFGDWPDGLPGLFDYRAATAGDGLLLPTIVAILLAVLRIPTLVRSKRERAWGIGSALIGLAVGASTQAAWLADDSPARNWSFPEAHQFNAAGWYHAVFLTAACGLVVTLAVLAALRVRATRRRSACAIRPLASSPWLGVFFGAAVALAGLIVADNERAAGTAAGDATTVALVLGSALGLALLAWAFGSSLRAGAPWLAAGAASAAILTLGLS